MPLVQIPMEVMVALVTTATLATAFYVPTRTNAFQIPTSVIIMLLVVIRTEVSVALAILVIKEMDDHVQTQTSVQLRLITVT